MQARQCWTVLARKADDQCERIQQQLANMQQRLEGLQANERRLRQLYAEYHQRMTSPGTHSQGMQDTIHQRQFMQQISALLEQVLQDQSITRQAMTQARQRLTAAQQEKMKMQALVEQDLHRQRTLEKLKDQRLMDELALRQFHLRHQPGHA